MNKDTVVVLQRVAGTHSIRFSDLTPEVQALIQKGEVADYNPEEALAELKRRFGSIPFGYVKFRYPTLEMAPWTHEISSGNGWAWMGSSFKKCFDNADRAEAELNKK